MRVRVTSVSRGTQASAGVALLITLSCALCGLVVAQWFQDAKLREQIAGLDHRLEDLAEQKKNIEGSAARVELELKRVESLRLRLQEQDATNKQEMSQLRKDSIDFRLQLDRVRKEADAYKDAYEKQKAITAQANETIKQANEGVKRISGERDAVAAKYNDLVVKQETLIKQYNTLSDYVKKLQEAGGPAADKDKK